jgi:hypothetical protein
MSKRFNRFSGIGIAGLMLGSLLPEPALATPVCTHLPRLGWVSAEEVEARLNGAGFKLLRLRITNEACYAALVRNRRGEVLEIRVHPATSQIMPVDAIETGAVRP